MSLNAENQDMVDGQRDFFGNVGLVNSNMWTSDGEWRIFSKNQSSKEGGDHLLTAENGLVLCNGNFSDNRTIFKQYAAAFPRPDGSGRSDFVFMLECLAPGETHGDMICLENDKVFSKKRTVDYTTWDDAESALMFLRKPFVAGVHYSVFESYKHKGRYLGFNSQGHVISPTKVQTNKDEGAFLVIRKY